MPANVSGALNSDTSEIVTVTTTAIGVYTNGIYIKGVESTFKCICSVQQPTPEEIQYLPEGERSKDLRKFISNKMLISTQNKDELIADRVYYQGNYYKIIHSAKWDVYGHVTCIGARD